MKATAISNSNIALIKFWGRNPDFTPTVSNLAITMDDQLMTKTTVEFSKDFETDELILNNEICSGSKLKMAKWMLDVVRDYAKTYLKAKIISNNTFPHAAGLASSASGFSALTAAATKALGFKPNEQELANLIALGPSGSATRSIYGEMVEWNKDGSISQIDDNGLLKDLRNVIVIVEKSEKKVSSNKGAVISQKTSPFYEAWTESSKQDLTNLKKSIKEKNYNKFFETIMRNSNSLHSLMLSSYQPLIYMNQVSHKIIEKVHEINKEKNICGYTFDAGPNAHIFTTVNKVDNIKYSMQSIDGVKEIIVCKPGKNGIRFTEEHLT